MLDPLSIIDKKAIAINGGNYNRFQQQQNDRKQGFDVIWYYCYLKYFAGKESRLLPTTNVNSKAGKQMRSSPQKKQQQKQQNYQQNQKQFSQSSQSLKQPQSNTNIQSTLQHPPSQHPSPHHPPLTLPRIQQTIRLLKQNYLIQTIQQHSQHTLNTIRQRALLSRNDRFFVIQPQQEIKQMQQRLRGASVSLKVTQDGTIRQMESYLEDMVLELYSYYLNSKNVYLIYKRQQQHQQGMANNNIGGFNASLNNNSNKLLNNNNNILTPVYHYYYEKNSISSSIDSTENRLKMILTHNSSQSRLNTSKDSKGSLNNQRNQRRSYGSLKSSLVRNDNNNNNNSMGNKLLQQDSILMLGNNHLVVGAQSLLGQGQKLDNKIQQMEIIDKFTQFDGLELWNIKYKKIPHTFIKFKKQSWTKCLNLPILHPSAPKTINQLPIIPKITKLNPSIDKLQPFVSLIKMLQTYFPNLLPSIDSIFQYNNMPYVFLEEDNGYGSWKWETNIGVLCYFVVYGNDQETLSVKKVERWVEQNGDSVLGRTIKEMMKRQKEKNRKRKELLRSIGQNSNGNNDSNNNNNNNSNNISSNSNVNNSNNSTPLTQPLQPLQIVSTVTLSPSLQMLITKDENSDLAIW